MKLILAGAAALSLLGGAALAQPDQNHQGGYRDSGQNQDRGDHRDGWQGQGDHRQGDQGQGGYHQGDNHDGDGHHGDRWRRHHRTHTVCQWRHHRRVCWQQRW